MTVIERFLKYVSPILFPVTTIIIMELFINKMRRLKGIRKMVVIEEAWL